MFFTRLKDHVGIPGVIATVALVFAMTGGAFAAKYLITSTKQIKPSVLKALKGKTGPAGAAGPTGPGGPQGPAGAVGAKGADGTDGKSVVSGSEPKGANCPEGGSNFEVEGSGVKKFACNGSPWTAGGTLPAGATLTGSWAFGATPEGGPTELRVPISFPIPLTAALGSSGVHYINSETGKEIILNVGLETTEEVTQTTCLGTVAAPAANSGHLCVYQRQLTGATIWSGAAVSRILRTGQSGAGASTAGAYLNVRVDAANAKGVGTWAVTG